MMNKAEILEIISLSKTLKKSTRPGFWIIPIATAFKENKLLAAITNHAIYTKLPPFLLQQKSLPARFPVLPANRV